MKCASPPGAPARLAYQSWSRTYPALGRAQPPPAPRQDRRVPLRALRELHRSGAEWIEQCKPLPENAAGEDRGLTPISLARVGARIARRAVTKALYLDQWSLAFRFGRGRATCRPTWRGFTRIVPPRGRDWADPFALHKDGRYYVFFEELPYAAGKAHIAMLEVDRNGPLVRAGARAGARLPPLVSVPVEHDGSLS